MQLTAASYSHLLAASLPAERTLALDRLLYFLSATDTTLDQRARRTSLEPAREDVPPRGARRHLELQVSRPVDELEHRVRRIVALPMSELVYARVAARSVRVARRERLEHFGQERGCEEEGAGFLPGRVAAALAQSDDLCRFTSGRLC